MATLAHRRLTVDDVIKMSEVGILDERERVELRDGVLVEMNAESLDHAETIEALGKSLGDRYYGTPTRVRIQTILYINEFNYLLPDLLVRNGPRGGWPTPEQVPLMIEVAFSSLRYDLEVKALDYARWGVPTYWVVDLVHRQIVVHSDPVEGVYRSIVRVNEDIELEVPDAQPLAAREVLSTRE
jgi:Uma2 family endonuclease